MVWTVFRIGIGRLLHNRMELLLTFVVPIAFFSIFAVIFGEGLGASSTPKIKAVVVDTIASPRSQQAKQAIESVESLRMFRATDRSAELTAEQAQDLVRRGVITLAVVLRTDSDSEADSESSADLPLRADLLLDASDQVAGQMASALVAQILQVVNAPPAGMPPSLPPGAGSAPFAPSYPRTARDPRGASAVPADNNTTETDWQVPLNGSLGPHESMVRQTDFVASESTASDAVQPVAASALSASDAASGNPPTEVAAAGPVASDPSASPVRMVDVLSGDKTNPVVSMYAAGIAVMFLLFGASGGGAALLEERENTTLERLMTTRLSMDQLLLGKWVYQTCLGVLQVIVMFLWGWLVFQVDLWNHLDGFLLMTVVTAGAASSFGLLMATACRTRGQLNGISVILILTMSALGGSMVPRYLMSDTLREAGLYTFNAWALDGFDKVFWRELPVSELWPQVCVLMLSSAVMLILSRVLAIRWESA